VTRFANFNTTYVEFVAEVPSVTAMSCDHTDSQNNVHQRHYHTATHEGLYKGMTLETFQKAILAIPALLNEAHMLTYPRATEIVVFMMSDLNRTYHPERPHSVPVAYGLRGYSMTTDVMRKMMNEVHEKATSKGLKVLVISSDGEAFPLATTDSGGLPLTKLKLMKDIWKEIDKKKKGDLINDIVQSKTLGNPTCIADVQMQAIVTHDANGGVSLRSKHERDS
jgi:hypothetical protein